jgi:hypothetical protein
MNPRTRVFWCWVWVIVCSPWDPAFVRALMRLADAYKDMAAGVNWS